MTNTKRLGYTLFELIAVLTVSGIIFMVIMGSWNSWSTVHACNGAASILRSGIQQARTLAQAKNKYVAFEFGSFSSSQMQQISGFQIYLCTNEMGNTEQLLPDLEYSKPMNEQNNTVLTQMGITQAGPPQRLSNHIDIISFPSDSNGKIAILIFRPDGSVYNNYNINNIFIYILGRRNVNIMEFIDNNIGLPDSEKLCEQNILHSRLKINLVTGYTETKKGEDIKTNEKSL